MTEENKIVSDEIEQGNDSKDEKLVPAKYREDMFKEKARRKELEEKLRSFELEKEDRQREEAERQKKFEELYKQERSKAEQAQKVLQDREKALADQFKLNAVKSQIGELQKEDFAKFINLSNIEVDEQGQPTAESVKLEAERFKQEFPMCLKKPATGTLPNAAPVRSNKNTGPKQIKSVDDFAEEWKKLRVNNTNIQTK